MNISKRCMLMNASFKSQFSYCPLWMCHTRANNGKIKPLLANNIFRQTIIVWSAVGKDGSASIHIRNLQILATEMCKIRNELSHFIVTELFEQNNEQHYHLRKNSQFTIPPIRTVYHGSESISFLGRKIFSQIGWKIPIA